MGTKTAAPAPGRVYKASAGKPEIVQVPPIGFIMIDGRGDPNTAVAYQEAIQALYSVSYTLKFALKKELAVEYKVGPLEGLWWSDNMSTFGSGGKDNWQWTAMIAQPDEVTTERFEQAVEEVARKKDLPALPLARLERFEEGPCAQILHIGPFSAEGPTIALLHEFIAEQGHTFDGKRQKHHEIYLSDPRRSAPEKWKTIIRQPFTP
jgi:hypothetical protein